MDKQTSVLIDTDMGLDDWMAIVFLLNHPSIDVRAISIAGTGLSDGKLGISNAYKLLDIGRKVNIPVSGGGASPLEGNRRFPEVWCVNENTCLDLLPTSRGTADYELKAVDLIIKTAIQTDNQIDIVALGPLTNIAEALIEAEAEISSKIRMIYIMGGAVNVPGNVSDSITGTGLAAEWNMYIDPKAASIVLNSRVPITLVPLDATNCVPVTMEFYRRLGEQAKTPQAAFIRGLIQYREDELRRGEFYFWDPLTAAVATDESIVKIKKIGISIAEIGPDCGRTYEDKEGKKIRVATKADPYLFESVYLDVLNLEN